MGVVTYPAFSVRDRRGNAMANLPVGSIPAPSSIFRRWILSSGTDHTGAPRRHMPGIAALAVALALAAPSPARAASPEGQLTWGVHISLAPTWFEPAETPGMITPYMVLYALHDSVVKPMPGKPFAPSLAESWSMSKDGTTYEFVLRDGVTFHNGDPVTSEDVKFSFERYRGAARQTLKDKVAAIETPDSKHVRFKLKEPWPDFMTFYTTATGASWVVPKKYVELVGDEGFKKAPIGAGPYKFVSFTPGLELTLEAFDQYWRKKPSVKRLVFKVIPDETTRLAALKRGEVDIVYSIRGELAEELQRTKGLTLKPVVIQGTFWLYFPDQWDAKSPWHDQRLRLAAALAVDHATINQALTLGHSRITGSIIPDSFDYYWKPPAPKYDPVQAKKLLADAGHPGGFDAGDYYCDATYANLAEAVINNLQAVGIRAKLRPLERAAFFKEYSEKKLKNIIQGASGAFGNAATRLEAFVVKGGAYSYGSYPDIDALFKGQASELDRTRREDMLHKIQQLVLEKSMYAHLWQLAFINGAGPRVGESGLGLIDGHAYSAPYEDVTLAGK
jgi:peptide/nickel transport system substrate-binding protein